jgi:hypothetical protein
VAQYLLWKAETQGALHPEAAIRLLNSSQWLNASHFDTGAWQLAELPFVLL